MNGRQRQCPLCEDRVTFAEICPEHAVPTIDVSMFDGAHVPISVGTVISHRYRVERILDVGGMGTVLIAVQIGMNRPIALKILRGQQAVDLYLVKRFYHEAQAISSLNHPNIVQVFDFGFDPQVCVPFLAMELVEGRTLEELVRSGKMPERRITRLLAQVAKALFEAHGKGIVHRDLKPANIMVTRLRDGEEHVKVLDFGVAKILRTGTDGLTAPGSTVGSPHYMSPEQARADDVDYRSDLYSLGCVLFEALTGNVPFDDDRTLEVMRMQVLHRAPPLPPRLADGRPPSAGLIALLDALLEKAPEDRPVTAAVVSEILGKLSRGEAVDVVAELRAERESGRLYTPRDARTGVYVAEDAFSSMATVAIEPDTDRDAAFVASHAGTRPFGPPRRPSGGRIETRHALDSSASLDPTSRSAVTAPTGPGQDTLLDDTAPSPVADARGASARMRILNLSTMVPSADQRPSSGPAHVPTIETLDDRPRTWPSAPDTPAVADRLGSIVERARFENPSSSGSGDPRPPTAPLVRAVAPSPFTASRIAIAVSALAFIAVAVLLLVWERSPATAPIAEIEPPVEERVVPEAVPVERPPVEPVRPEPEPVRAAEPERRPAPAKERPRPREPAKEADNILVESEPPGADVVRDGRVLGRTPLNVARPKKPDTVRLTLRKAGYVERRVDLTEAAGAEVRVKLMEEW